MPGEDLDGVVLDGDAGQHDPASPAIMPSEPMLTGLALLDAIRSNSSDPGRALLGALAGQAGGGTGADLLMKFIGQHDEAEIERIREELRDEVRAEQADAVAELSDIARRLFAERDEARGRLEELAAALGACPACFGEDLLCPTCHGAGEPGARAPDPAAFRRFVAPALERASAVMRRTAARRPWPQPNRTPTPPPPSFHPATVNKGGTTS